MNLIMIMSVFLFVSCSRHYYRAPEKPQSYYIENLKNRRISLVGFLEIHSESKSTTTTHFTSSGKVYSGPSRSTRYYPADVKDWLQFGTRVKNAELQEGLNSNQNKEGIAHFLKRYNEAPKELKKKYFEEISHIFEFDPEIITEKDSILPEDVSLKNLDTDYLLLGNMREDPPEVKVQVFYIIPYIFLSAFSLFTIPLIVDVSDSTAVYHLYDRDMKLIKTFQARLDVVEIAAWWTKILPRFERECVRESTDPDTDICPRGIGDIRFFLLRHELNEYLNKNPESSVLILKNGKRIKGKYYEKAGFYIVTDEKGNTEKIRKEDVDSIEF